MISQHAAATLTIDLGAVRDNYRLLKKQLNGVPCAAVVKANGYGLGAIKIATTLFQDGCRDFFVALLDEGIELRNHLPHDATIHILGGLLPNTADVYHHYDLIPVLGSLPEIKDWKHNFDGLTPPCNIHIDTGMSRLGLSPSEINAISENSDLISGLNINIIISHLVMADEPGAELNQQQLDRFKKAVQVFPENKRSFANSSGIFLKASFHFDLGRPGAALYGLNPNSLAPNPMRQVVELKGKIVQVHDVDTPQTVGYGATHRILNKGRIATVPVGYADGYLRSLSNSGQACIGGHLVDVVGRVSMDLITLDISHIPENLIYPGAPVELIGAHMTPDQLATKAGTIGYEILTSLGPRYQRIYLDANGTHSS